MNKIKKEIFKMNTQSSNILINENIIDILLNKPIPYKKTKDKIRDNFIIPEYREYNNLIEINYNLTQLKMVAKFYKLKLAGNKDMLRKRIYNYLLHSYYAIYVQKFIRRHFIKKYIKLHGPGFFYRQKCANDTDFGTLDYLYEIPYNQFFSFKDEAGFIYGFDIQSIYNLYLKSTIQVENPFNKKIIDHEVFNNVIKYVNLSKLLNININLDYEKLNNLNESKQLEMKILTLFQSMDSLGNYTHISWFNELSKHNLIRFFKELLDIWNYRANLTQEAKREICPPYGNPFRNINIPIQQINAFNYNIIKKNIVIIMEELITKGINNDSKALGCYYILSALTLVNQSAAEAMPWLFDSVVY